MKVKFEIMFKNGQRVVFEHSDDNINKETVDGVKSVVREVYKSKDYNAVITVGTTLINVNETVYIDIKTEE